FREVARAVPGGASSVVRSSRRGSGCSGSPERDGESWTTVPVSHREPVRPVVNCPRQGSCDDRLALLSSRRAAATMGAMSDSSAPSASTVTVTDEGDRFEARTDDGTVAGFAAYERTPGTVIFTHTEVDPAFEGRGVGSALAAGAPGPRGGAGGRGGGRG